MKHYKSIGCSPWREECTQVGQNGYYERMIKELGVFKRQLERSAPPPPAGAFLSVKLFSHDFGTYGEVVAWFSTPEGENWAYDIEDNVPEFWEKEALEELKEYRIII